MIEGVTVETITIRADERGRLLEAFEGSGQVILTTLNPGAIKGWHRHAACTDTFICVQGMVRMGLYDER